MEKVIIGAVVGIFVGAFTVEILNRKSPNTVKNIEDKASKFAAAIAKAFDDGYRGMQKAASESKDSAEAKNPAT